MKKPSPALSSRKKKLAPQAGGFTLVEVLTVIAIISILMTAGAIGLGNLTAGKGTSSAIATCESLFEEARTIAISKRCKARVLIAEDLTNDDPNKNLRKVFIVHEEIDPVTGSPRLPTSWVVSGRGYTMPTGVFFSKVYSKPDAIGPDRVMELLGVQSAYQGNHIYYEFNGEGIATIPGASFIIAAGVRPKGGQPRTTKGAERDFAGFVIWRNGRTSTYRSPDQMGIPANVKDF